MVLLGGTILPLWIRVKKPTPDGIACVLCEVRRNVLISTRFLRLKIGCVRSVVPPIPAFGASIERSDSRTGIRYPASEWRLGTTTISHTTSLLRATKCIDMIFLSGKSVPFLDMFHEQLPLPVPCYDLVLVTEFAVVLREADLRAPPAPLT